MRPCRLPVSPQKVACGLLSPNPLNLPLAQHADRAEARVRRATESEPRAERHLCDIAKWCARSGISASLLASVISSICLLKWRTDIFLTLVFVLSVRGIVSFENPTKIESRLITRTKTRVLKAIRLLLTLCLGMGSWLAAHTCCLYFYSPTLRRRRLSKTRTLLALMQ